MDQQLKAALATELGPQVADLIELASQKRAGLLAAAPAGSNIDVTSIVLALLDRYGSVLGTTIASVLEARGDPTSKLLAGILRAASSPEIIQIIITLLGTQQVAVAVTAAIAALP